MGKLTVTEFVTLDGVAQAPGAPDEDRDLDFPYGGWQADLMEAGSGEIIFERARDMDALLLGRKTYDIFASYWPTGPEDSPFTELLNQAPKYVASRTLIEPLEWNNSTLLDNGDLVNEVKALKERYDRVHVIGSLDLLQTLLRNNLVDELELWMYPVVLGAGKRVFADGTVPTTLRLVESDAGSKGALHLTYESAGEPTYGTIG